MRTSKTQQEILQLIVKGHTTGAKLSAATGRSAQGCAQTAASLIRRGWLTRERYGAGPVLYKITPDGRKALIDPPGRCQACVPGSGVYLHTCGLASLQRMFSLPSPKDRRRR